MGLSYKKAVAIGVTNKYSEDLGAYTKDFKRKEYEGFCTGLSCCEEKRPMKRHTKKENRQMFSTKYKEKIFVTRDKSKERCDRCGNFLLWLEKEKKGDN